MLQEEFREGHAGSAGGALTRSPMASSVAVTRPEGCEPGDIIFVTTKSGLDIEVEVPDGVGPGEVFDVEFEASTALLQVSEGPEPWVGLAS